MYMRKYNVYVIDGTWCVPSSIMMQGLTYVICTFISVGTSLGSAYGRCGMETEGVGSFP